MFLKKEAEPIEIKENEKMYTVEIYLKYSSLLFSNVDRKEIKKIKKWFLSCNPYYVFYYSNGFSLLNKKKIENINIKEQ